MGFIKQIRWKSLLGIFKLKRIVDHWYGVRQLDFKEKKILIRTSTLREYETRARSVAKEPDTVSWIKGNAATGSVLYDVGANVGAYSLIAGSLGMDVYAFEPTDYNVASLGINIRLNNLDHRISIIACALGAEAHVATFSLADTTSGSSQGFYEGSAVRAPHSARIPISRLDTVRETFNLPEPNAMKIDVDGGEVDVLVGAEKTLTREALRTVLIESSNEHKERIVDLMKGYAFRLSREVRMDARTINLFFDRV
jgi:FkbM family methyltransferase